jgi:hypothetical protein
MSFFAHVTHLHEKQQTNFKNPMGGDFVLKIVFYFKKEFQILNSNFNLSLFFEYMKSKNDGGGF